MPVMRGRVGLPCAAREEPIKQATRTTAIWFIRITLNFDMRRDCLGNGSLLRAGVLAGELGAAGFLDWLEFHEFDAGLVGVVDVELPFAVAPDLGLFR